MSFFITPALFMLQPSGLQGTLYRGDHLKPTQGSPGIYSHAGWPFTRVVFVPQSVQDLTLKRKGRLFPYHANKSCRSVAGASSAGDLHFFDFCRWTHLFRNRATIKLGMLVLLLLFFCMFVLLFHWFFWINVSSCKQGWPPHHPPIRDLINWMDGQ